MSCRKTIGLVTLFAVCAQVGCGDPNKLSESIIRPIVQANLDERSQSDDSACPKIHWPYEGPTGCITPEYIEVAEKRGWIAASRTPQGDCVGKVTDEGKKQLIGIVDGFGPEATKPITVCHAKGFELVSIDEWTPPAPMAGDTISIVKYKYKRANIAPWVAKLEGDPDLALFFAVPKDLHDERSGEIWLRLTNNGWRAR